MQSSALTPWSSWLLNRTRTWTQWRRRWQQQSGRHAAVGAARTKAASAALKGCARRRTSRCQKSSASGRMLRLCCRSSWLWLADRRRRQVQQHVKCATEARQSCCSPAAIWPTKGRSGGRTGARSPCFVPYVTGVGREDPRRRTSIHIPCGSWPAPKHRVRRCGTAFAVILCGASCGLGPPLSGSHYSSRFGGLTSSSTVSVSVCRSGLWSTSLRTRSRVSSPS